MKRNEAIFWLMLASGALSGGKAQALNCDNVHLDCAGSLQTICTFCATDVQALQCAVQNATNGSVLCLTEAEYIFTAACCSGAALPKPSVNLTIRGVNVNPAALRANSTGYRLIGNGSNSPLYFDNVRIEKFSTSGYPGGAVKSTGSLTMTNSILLDNSAKYGGAIFSEGGAVWIKNSTIKGNSATSNGGAIYGKGSVVIESSTLIDNSASNGGAIFTENAYVGVESSTLSGNSADREGAIIYARDKWSSVEIENSTLVKKPANAASAIYLNSELSTAILESSIIKGGNFCSGTGTFVSVGKNLMQVNTVCGFDYDVGDIPCTDPSCGIASELRYNGGPTQTFSLLPDSQAKGNGACPADQRGVLPGGGVQGECDIGAYQAVCSVDDDHDTVLDLNVYMDFKNPTPGGNYTVMNSGACQEDVVPHGAQAIQWNVIPFDGYVATHDSSTIQAYNIYFHEQCHRSNITSAACESTPVAGMQPASCTSSDCINCNDACDNCGGCDCGVDSDCVKPSIFVGAIPTPTPIQVNRIDSEKGAVFYTITELAEALKEKQGVEAAPCSITSPQAPPTCDAQVNSCPVCEVGEGDSWWYSVQWSQNVDQGSWDPRMECEVQ